ncbi:S49 family peptidase [uncultured Deinococcus sp.]|uniref:S49 family peptidase n=1 Tax=uncultured Deinococcus sp. TaxID=158789 RepID=UPI0025F78DF3|nr:S49 family peptidase [uncultured Deinococcus sp.]
MLTEPKTRSPTRLSGLTALIANGKWAVRPEHLHDIVTGFDAYLRGAVSSDHLLAELRDQRAARAAASQQTQAQAPSVAVLSLYGTIFPRGSLMVEYCGAVDAHTFAARVRAAAADSSVSSIVIDIDSGGGAVSGVDVAAQAVRDAAAVKRVTAVANTTMCSAAYWIASGATDITVTPAGEVGSIGVIGTHTDQTAALEGEGLKVTYVRSAERKALGQPAEAMADTALAQWQDEIDRVAALFVQDIAAGRGVTVPQARKWATGDVWFGQDAVDQGLADTVGTLDGVIAEHLQAAQSAPAPSVRSGQVPSADAPPKESSVILQLKDRSGTTHAIDTDSPTALADAQAFLSAAETHAHEAGSATRMQAVATALDLEPAGLTDAALATLRRNAADGQTYRAHLTGDVEKLAVAVYGAETPGVATTTRLAAKADIDELRGMVDDLTARKAALIPAGRRSAEDTGDADADAPAPAPKTPTRAFDF